MNINRRNFIGLSSLTATSLAVGLNASHTHSAKSSYVISGGKIKVYLEKGEILFFDEKAGTADWGEYVGKHYVENIGNTTVKIILTEIKS